MPGGGDQTEKACGQEGLAGLLGDANPHRAQPHAQAFGSAV